MRNWEEKKLAIIEKSSDLMYLKGYNGTGVQELADAAAIPKGSFYYYFKSKEDFAIAAMNKYSKDRCETFNQILSDKSVSPLKRIDNLFSRMIDHFSREEKFTKGCFVGNLCEEMGDISRPIGKAADKFFNLLKEPFQECLSEAQENGEISSSHDVEQLSEFIINSMEGSLLRMKASKNAKSMKLFKHMVLDVLLNTL